MKNFKFVISLVALICVSINLCSAQEKKPSFWDKAKQKVEKVAKKVEKAIDETLQTPVVTPKSTESQTQSRTEEKKQEAASTKGENTQTSLTNTGSKKGNQVHDEDYDKAFKTRKQLLDQKLKQNNGSTDLIYLEYLKDLINIGYGERNHKEEALYMEDILRKIPFGKLPSKKLRYFCSVSESIGMAFMKVPDYEKASIYLYLIPQNIASLSNGDEVYVPAQVSDPERDAKEKKLEESRNLLYFKYLSNKDYTTERNYC